MRTATTTTTTTRTLTVRAPGLAPLVAVLLDEKAHPDDRRVRISRALLARSGADRCPGCARVFDLEGYAKVRTPFHARESLTCGGCQRVYVVAEQDFA